MLAGRFTRFPLAVNDDDAASPLAPLAAAAAAAVCAAAKRARRWLRRWASVSTGTTTGGTVAVVVVVVNVPLAVVVVLDETDVAVAPDTPADEDGIPMAAGVGDAGTGSVMPGFPNTSPLAPPDPNAPNAPVDGDSFKNGPLAASRACVTTTAHPPVVRSKSDTMNGKLHNTL